MRFCRAMNSTTIRVRARVCKAGCWVCAAIAIILACFATSVPAAEPAPDCQIKAVCLLNFAQFTEWPSQAFLKQDSPLVIAILGADPFGSLLDDTVRDEVVRGRRLIVQRYRKIEEIKSCHILYIGQSESNRLEHIVKMLDGKPVLTVSDIPGAAPRGVMIRFLTEETKVRFRINNEAAKAANLTLSSKLLRAADVVRTRKK